jgi:hypothetical protein
MTVTNDLWELWMRNLVCKYLHGAMACGLKFNSYKHGDGAEFTGIFQEFLKQSVHATSPAHPPLFNHSYMVKQSELKQIQILSEIDHS